jgi:hypothetical protein
MRVSNSMPGCGLRSLGVRGSLADRRAGAKKRFGCVTTRGRNFGVFSGLGHKFDSLTALLLCLSVLGSDISILTTLSLAPRRLPATDLPQALGLLTVALVPAPRLVLATTPLTQAVSDARSARSGPTAMISRTLASAHGRSCSQGKARGECANTLSEHHQNINQTDAC